MFETFKITMIPNDHSFHFQKNVSSVYFSKFYANIYRLFQRLKQVSFKRLNIYVNFFDMVTDLQNHWQMTSDGNCMKYAEKLTKC